MKPLLREAMEEGAWGISTGLDYPPGSYADTDELAALSQAARARRDLPHPRPLRTGRQASSTRSAKRSRSAARSGIATPHHPLLPGAITSRGRRQLLRHWSRRRATIEGLDVTFDSYPYI